MTSKERYENIIRWFSVNMPDAASELDFSNPFQCIVAVILSAQCTDKRVNMVTPALFEAYPTPQKLARADFDDVYALVKSVSYPNAKSHHLIEMAQMLVKDFKGEVPHDIEDLVKLPGVGRKTANVVASICFGAPVIAVDTHVFRVSHRLGLSKGANVEKVEKDLTVNIPEEIRAMFHHWILLHGRYVCTARNPYCEQCGLNKWCQGYKKDRKKNNNKI